MGLGKWIGIVVFIASLYVVWQLRQVLLLIFAAVVLATALSRLVQLYQRLGVRKRGVAIALTVVSLLALIAGFFLIIVPPFADQVQQLINYVPRGFERAQQLVERAQEIISRQPVEISSFRGFTQQLQVFASRMFGNFFTIFSNSINLLLSSFLVFILSIMLLANPRAYRQGFVLLFPSFYRRRIDDILGQCNTALGGWATGIIFNMTVIGVFSGLGLWILQVPLALANAVLAGVLTFIPNVGPALSVIPPLALALLDAPWKAIAVIILYVAVQQLETNVLTPLVMEKQVSLLPAVTLASQVIFASFFGFLGLFLALPLMVVLQVWVKELLVKDVFNNWSEPRKFRNAQESDVESDRERDEVELVVTERSR